MGHATINICTLDWESEICGLVLTLPLLPWTPWALLAPACSCLPLDLLWPFSFLCVYVYAHECMHVHVGSCVYTYLYVEPEVEIWGLNLQLLRLQVYAMAPSFKTPKVLFSVHVHASRDPMQEPALSFHCVCSLDQTQAVGCSGDSFSCTAEWLSCHCSGLRCFCFYT